MVSDSDTMEREIARCIEAWQGGEQEGASIAETFVRILSMDPAYPPAPYGPRDPGSMRSDIKIHVKPGYVPLRRNPDSSGFVSMVYVSSVADVARVAAMRRRSLTVRAGGLPKAREKTRMGFVGISDGKTRDHKSRKLQRATRAVTSFIRSIDRNLRATKNARDAVTEAKKTRAFFSVLLRETSVRAKFSNKARKEMYGAMRYANAVVKAGASAGYH